MFKYASARQFYIDQLAIYHQIIDATKSMPLVRVKNDNVDDYISGLTAHVQSSLPLDILIKHLHKLGYSLKEGSKVQTGTNSYFTYVIKNQPDMQIDIVDTCASIQVGHRVYLTTSHTIPGIIASLEHFSGLELLVFRGIRK